MYAGKVHQSPVTWQIGLDNGELDQDDGLDDFRRTDRRAVITATGSFTSKKASHHSTNSYGCIQETKSPAGNVKS